MFKCQCPECRQSNMNHVYNYSTFRKVECSACGHKFVMNQKQTERYEKEELEWEDQKQKAANSSALIEYNNRKEPDFVEQYISNYEKDKKNNKSVNTDLTLISASTSNHHHQDDYQSPTSFDYYSSTSTDNSSSNSTDIFGGGDTFGAGSSDSW